MSKALDGEHYCKAHQGNYSHYAEHNCTVCKLKRQRDMLLEALKPFANEANKYDPDEGDSSQRIWDTTLMIGHLRKARTAIAAVEEEK